MAVDPFQIATQGVGPGWTTFGFATQGFGFEVEVIIEPSKGGGGFYGSAEPYTITIRITYKGKKWEEKRLVSALIAGSLEKVIASFKSAQVSIVGVVATINNIISKKMTVFVRRKR